MACYRNWYPIHLLTCGHYVQFSDLMGCKINCQHIAQQFEDGPQENCVFLICERCILDEFRRRVRFRWDKCLQELKSTAEYQQADVVEQRRLRNELSLTSGLMGEYEVFRDDCQGEQIDRGGLPSELVDMSQLVDEMTDTLSGTKIESEEDGMLNLLDSLKVSSAEEATPDKMES